MAYVYLLEHTPIKKVGVDFFLFNRNVHYFRNDSNLFSFLVPKRTQTLEKLIEKLEKICDQDLIITTQTIQLVIGSLNRISFVVPKLCEKMLSFVNENQNIVGADTVAHLLFYMFSMGYEPRSAMFDRETQLINSEPSEFEGFTQIIHRDFEMIPAFLIVQGCLALSFYQALSLDLIKRVFNIDFVTRLERELTLMFESVKSDVFICYNCGHD